jgi:photosystem II stability/assembly factor-like uncharacterized protein
MVILNPNNMRYLFCHLFILLFVFSFSTQAQWTSLSGPNGAYVRKLERASDGTLYLLANTPSLFKSTNGGTSWQKVTASSSPNFFMYDLLVANGKFYALYFGSFYTSTDGITWTKTATTFPFSSANRILRFGADGLLIVYGFDGIFLSRDEGVTWTKILTESPIPYGDTYNNVAATANGDLYAYSNTLGIRKFPYPGLAGSLAESNWQTMLSIPSTSYVNFLASGSSIYASTYNDLKISTNAGTSWTSVKRNITDTFFYGSWGLAPGGAVYYSNSAYGNIYTSSNPSTTNWTSTLQPFSSYGGNPTSFVFENATTYYLGSDGFGVNKTTNNGGTWTLVNSGLTEASMYNCKVGSTGNIIQFSNSSKGYWQSTDSGSSWSFVGLTDYLTKSIKLSDGKILLYGYGYVYKSNDATAAAFTKDVTYYNSLTDISEASNGDVYGIAGYVTCPTTCTYSLKVYKSTDKLATPFTDITATITGLPSSASYISPYHITVDNLNNIFFSIYDSSTGTYKLYKISGTTCTQITTLPSTSFLNNLFVSGSKLYAIQSSSYYASSDQGVTWSTVGFSGSYVFPLKQGTYTGICVSRAGSLYVTQDDGQTWNSSSLPTSTTTITDIDAASSGAYFASAQNSTGLKNNSALLVDPTTLPPYINFNWQALNGPYGGSVTRLRAHPDGTTLFAIANGNFLWKYSSGSWSKVTISTSPFTATTLIFDVEVDATGAVYIASTASSPQKIYKSIDKGVTWSALTSTNLPASSSAIRRLEILSDGSMLGFGNFGGFGKIYKSTDNGATFSSVYTSTLNIFYTRLPAISPTDVVATFGNSAEGVVISTDKGSTWTAKSTSSIIDIDPNKGSVSSLVFDNTGSLLLTGFPDVTAATLVSKPFKSLDNGATWAAITDPLPNLSGFTKRTFALPSGEYIMSISNYFDYYRSTDKGVTWALAGNAGDLFTFNESIGSTSYFYGNVRGAQKTIDGGLTFSPENNNMPINSALDVEVFNNKDLLVGATSAYHSSDFGQSFTLANTQPATSFLVLGDSIIGYGSRQLQKSKDGGKTWTSIGTDRFFTFLTQDAGGSVYYAFSNTTLPNTTVQFGLFYSTDLINWTAYPLSGLPTSYFISGMVIDSGNIIYALVQDVNTGINDVYKIAFGSASKITQVIGATNPFKIIYYKNKIYLYDGAGVIYKSSDGQAWTATSAPAGNSLIQTNGYLFIPASTSVLWLSRDDGATWQSVGDVSVSGVNFRDVAINEFDGYAYATLSNSVVKKSGNIILIDDKTKPLATAFSPLNNATGIGLKPTFTITFDEVTKVVPGLKIRVFDAALSTPVEAIDISTAVQNGKSWSVTMTTTLPFNKTYFVTADAGVVTDLFGNGFLGISSNTTWRFTTKATPTVSLINPVNNATSILSNTILKVTFSEPLSGVIAKNINVYKSSSPTFPVVSLLTSSGVASGNDLTFNLPTSLEYNTSYFVKADVGAFQTIEGQAVTLLSLNTDWAFTTRAAPTVVSTVPTNNGTGIGVNTSLSITFSENVTLVGSAKLYVTNTAVPATPVATINLSAATVSGATATFTLPAALSYSTVYAVNFGANAFTSVTDGGTFSAVTTTGWQFTTATAPDTQAPAITYSPDSFVKGSGNKIISAAISDNVGVSQAKIFYRSITTNGAEISANLIHNSSTDKYDATIPESDFAKMGLEYYFTATDAANNSARSPQTGYHYSYISFGNINPQIPGGLIGVGGAITNWRIIAMPHALSDSKIATVFSELGADDFSKWRLITYKDQTAWDQYPANFTTFAQGKGYFINVLNLPSTGLVVEGATTPANNKANPFVFTLASGWNQIGNPYNFPMKWSEVLAANSSVSGIGSKLKTFTGTYVDDSDDQLEIYEGAFVLNSGSSPVSMTVPIVGSLSGGRVSSESYDLGNEQWVAPITLTIADLMNTFGGVGMYPNAKVGVDDHDDFNPPHFLNYAEMSFPHPEHFLQKSTRDIVPTQGEYVWDFTVDSNLSGSAEFTWDNTRFGTNSKELFLYDMQRGMLIDMRTQGSYTFDPKKSSSFKVYFGEDLKSKIKPQQILLGEAYPNPGKGNVTIPFSLPDASAQYQVQIEVYDIMGRRVSTLAEGFYKPGFYSSVWETGQSNLSDGLYIYRMKVKSNDKSEVFNGKIILNQ